MKRNEKKRKQMKRNKTNHDVLPLNISGNISNIIQKTKYKKKLINISLL